MSQDEKLLVSVRHKVILEILSENDEVDSFSLEIVPDEVADFKAGLLGETTPLAQAILGHSAGETLSYHAGDIVQVKILEVELGTFNNFREVRERKQAILQEAIRQSDLTNAIIFASAVNNKWGDYDPGALLDNWEKEKPKKED